jgi:hypothetical protein
VTFFLHAYAFAHSQHLRQQITIPSPKLGEEYEHKLSQNVKRKRRRNTSTRPNLLHPKATAYNTFIAFIITAKSLDTRPKTSSPTLKYPQAKAIIGIFSDTQQAHSTPRNTLSKIISAPIFPRHRQDTTNNSKQNHNPE